MQSNRDMRFHDDVPRDALTPSQVDQYRLERSRYFMRLAEVTQVLNAREGYTIYNRMTHSRKVADIGRNIAINLLRNQREHVEALNGIDVDVVGAACLAHDLGHPPFGHIGESTLDRLVVEHGNPEGYNGNAQAFRIVTKLAAYRRYYSGLNLSRATLNAVLKYPWRREKDGYRSRVFGAYYSELAEFNWAREIISEANKSQPSAEATIMDIADDIAYALSDIHDFSLVEMIPLPLLVASPSERAIFLEATFARWDSFGKKYSKEEYRKCFDELFDMLPFSSRFDHSDSESSMLNLVFENLTDRCIAHTRISEPKDSESPKVELHYEIKKEIDLLKALTVHYVHSNIAVRRQQEGQAAIIKTLFEKFMDNIVRGDISILPMRFQQHVAHVVTLPIIEQDHARVRLVADVISSMSDNEAIQIYGTLIGQDPSHLLKNFTFL